MIMYSSLSDFTASLVLEVIKLIVVMCGIFNFEVKKEKRYFFIFLGLSVPILTLLYYMNFMNAFSLPVTTIVLTLILISGKRKIIYAILANISISCVDEVVSNLISKSSSFKYEEFFLAKNSVSMVVFSLIAYIIQSRRRRGLDYSLKKMNVFYLVVLALAQFAMTYYITELRYQNGFNKLLMYVIITVVLMIELVLIYTLNRRDYYYNMSIMNQQVVESQEKYCMTLIEHDKEIRSFRHDVKNHLMCLDALISENKNTEAAEYISELMGSLALKSSEIRTGNTIVSAIASDYASKYSAVEFHWDGLIPEKLKISRVDVCTIFSNVLANAFENANKSENEKKVNVIIGTVNNSMIITVKNNVGSRAVEKDGLFETSKEDKANHGLGTQNIRKCVKSNSGEVDFKFDDEMFEVKIILPNALQVF